MMQAVLALALLTLSSTLAKLSILSPRALNNKFNGTSLSILIIILSFFV
jgi:hypothetical protein